MFEHGHCAEAPPEEPVADSLGGSSSAPARATVRDWVHELAAVDGRGPDGAGCDVERIETVQALEELKAAAAAAQARLTAAFAASQRAEQRRAGLRESEVGRGIGAQVALARRESPHRGSRLVGLAEALVHEMPRTMAALTAGETSEWRATVVARETACLPRELREQADLELGDRLGGLSDCETEAEAKRLAYRLDPAAYVNRSRGAAKDSRVTLRPAPDTMSRFGDQRGRGQLMAELLVERVTGQASATAVPVEVQLVVTDVSLFGEARVESDDQAESEDRAKVDEPGELLGHGPVPASLARDLVREAPQVWLRRLFASPETGELVAMESRRRIFPRGLRRFLVIRDRVCRTPWCGAPIRHIDHVIPAAAGGPTSADNGQGLCQACNLAREAPGMLARPGPRGSGDSVTTRTPTGHEYTSRPPPLPGARPPRGEPVGDDESVLERHLRRYLAAA